jgi:hypothetical protein
MLRYTYQIKTKSSDPENFIECFKQSIEREFQNIFAKVYIGTEKVEIENPPFSFLMVWNFFEIIGTGAVTISKQNNIVTISYLLNFSCYVFFWSLLTLVTFVIAIYQGSNVLSVAGLLLAWGVIIFLFTMVSRVRFRSKIVESIQSSQGVMLTE